MSLKTPTRKKASVCNPNDLTKDGQWTLLAIEYETEAPQTSISADHGPELISKVLDKWVHKHKVHLDLIYLHKPTQRAHIFIASKTLKKHVRQW